jgi:hypothetical protein
MSIDNADDRQRPRPIGLHPLASSSSQPATHGRSRLAAIVSSDTDKTPPEDEEQPSRSALSRRRRACFRDSAAAARAATTFTRIRQAATTAYRLPLPGEESLHDHRGRLASLAAGARLRWLASARLLAGATSRYDEHQDVNEPIATSTRAQSPPASRC